MNVFSAVFPDYMQVFTLSDTLEGSEFTMTILLGSVSLTVKRTGKEMVRFNGRKAVAQWLNLTSCAKGDGTYHLINIVTKAAEEVLEKSPELGAAR